MNQFREGQLVTIEFEGREFEVIVVNPNGLGEEQPSVGFGFRLMEKYAGIKEQTLSDWTTTESALEGDRNISEKTLKAPSGKEYKVTEIIGEDKNSYTVIEATDWFDLAFDVLKNPGKVRKPTREKLLDFVRWFAIKGFYAEVYVALKGSYTERDSATLSKWLLSRLEGITRRKEYTDFLQSQGCAGWDYSRWTDYIYTGLFDKTASQMKQLWKLIEGNKNIGRNYIPEAKGLDAVAYCEEMTGKLHIQNLKQAHDDAIKYTLGKFFDGERPRFEIELDN